MSDQVPDAPKKSDAIGVEQHCLIVNAGSGTTANREGAHAKNVRNVSANTDSLDSTPY